MGFGRALEMLAAVRDHKRFDATWKTRCRLYAELRENGLIAKKGRRHELTEKGARVLRAFGVD